MAWAKAHAIWISAPSKSMEELPAAVSNTEFLPAVNRQTLPNCGAYAPTYYMRTYLEARRRGWGRVNPWTHPERAVSPGIAYLFGQADVHGASIIGSIQVMRQVGFLGLSQLPDSYNYDRTVFPSATFLLEAMPNRGGELVLLGAAASDEGFLAIKEWLAGGGIGVFGMDISEATFLYGGEGEGPEVDNGVIFGLGGPRVDGHAFTLIGYDDNKEYNDGTGPRQGAFYGVNSWGQNWGVEDPDVGTRGFMWISYDYFRFGADMSLVYSMTVSAEPYEPRWVGVFQYEHPHSPQANHSFLGGNQDSPDWSEHFPPANPSEEASFAKSRPLAVDLTGDGHDWESIWWRPFNLGSIPGLPHPARTGTAHGFRIFRYEDAREAFAGPLFQGGSIQHWHIVPLETVEAPSLDMEGLPVESVILPNLQELNVGLMDGGEEFLDPPMVSGSAVFADFNGNGWPDLLVVGSTIQLYENMGGTFRAVENHGIGEYAGAAAAAGDYNRDGLPDLAICGAQGGVYVTRVYRNLGGLRFQATGAELTGVAGSQLDLAASIAWGDYDNDGLEDLAFWGFDNAQKKHIHVYRNRGDGSFEPAPFTLPERHGAQLSWNDVNANGLLDLCAGSAIFYNQGDGTLNTTPVRLPDGGLWGQTPDQGIWADFTGNGLPDLARVYSQRITLPGGGLTTSEQVQIYHNTGDGTLEYSGISLKDLQYPRLEAVDYNNDGLMDLASAHYEGSGGWVSGDRPRATKLYRQMPGGAFRDAGFNLLGTAEGAVALADIDGDGDLDLLTTGYTQTSGGPWQRGSRLHRSRFSQYPWGSRANTPPTPPVNLSVEVLEDSGDFIFLWDHGTDAETPQAGLAYNVRIGTWPGGSNILSPASSAPVTPTLRYYRISADQPGLILRDLPPAYYHWSVRTVDGGRMASEWAAEQSFAHAGGHMLEDFNLDSVFDAADLVIFARLVQDERYTLPMEFDFNNDGVVNQADVRTLARRLLGSGELFPGSYPVGPEGGTIALDGIEIVVPPGAFTSAPPVALTIETTDVGNAFDAEEVRTVYQVAGLPVNSALPYTIALENPFPPGGEPFVLVGEEAWARGSAGIDWRYRVMTPQVLPDGRYQIEIPATEVDKISSGEFHYSLNLGVLAGYAKYANARFSIAFPQRFVGDGIEALGQAFDAAYFALRDVHGFSYAARTRWPVEVRVHDMGPDLDGEMSSSYWGHNYGSLSINSRILGNLTRARATAAHEFFHIVQGFYDPRSARQQKWYQSQHYWLDEAMSTWAEALGVPDPEDYVSDAYVRDVGAPYMGVTKGITGSQLEAAAYGYGSPPLIKYLVAQEGPAALSDVYQAILTGSDSVAAIRGAVSSTHFFIWLDDYYSALVENRIYPIDRQTLYSLTTGENLRLRLDPGGRGWRRFPEATLTDLSAAMYRVFFNVGYPTPPEDAFWVFRLEGDPTLNLQVFRSTMEDPPAPVGAVHGYSDIRYLTIPGARSHKETSSNMVVLVTNTNADAPYTNERKTTLAAGVAWPGPFTLASNTVSGQAFGRSFPTMTGTGTLDAAAVSDLTETAGAGSFHRVQGAAWGADTVDLTVSYQATIDEMTDTWESGDNRYSLSTSGISAYELTQSGPGGTVIHTQTNDTGTFNITLGAGEREAGYTVLALYAHYPLTYTRNGVVQGNPTTEWILAVFVIAVP